MIDPEGRFFVLGQFMFGKKHKSHILDWDQRRWYELNAPDSYILNNGLDDVINDALSEEIRNTDIETLQRHINQLASSVLSITVDDHGRLIAVSSDPDEDPTLCIHYPRFSKAPSLHECSTISLSKLTELNRLGPGVDLMNCKEDTGQLLKVAFKYSLLESIRDQNWDEIHILKSIPPHPNIIPLCSIVLEDKEDRIVGFTTKFVPGGSLLNNKDRPFRLKWLQQLTKVVDYLNLELGIMHQDIALQNILVDQDTNQLQLFDFGHSGRIVQGDENNLHPGRMPTWDDITGVIYTLYEIITLDNKFRISAMNPQNVETVQELAEWPVKGKLDCDARLLRDHLNEWVRKRREPRAVGENYQSQKIADWPLPPQPTPYLTDYYDNPDKDYYTQCAAQSRQSAIKAKRHVMQWERPPYSQAYPERCTEAETSSSAKETGKGPQQDL